MTTEVSFNRAETPSSSVQDVLDDARLLKYTSIELIRLDRSHFVQIICPEFVFCELLLLVQKSYDSLSLTDMMTADR